MKLPIVYVRGFAGATSGINKAVDDPFYGFNEGSVHVRVGGGTDSRPHFHQFESPMLRLLLDAHDGPDETYSLLVQGGQKAYLEGRTDGSVSPMTIWIHRFYDEAASTLGSHPEKFTLEEAAKDLFALVQLVLAKTGAPRVHLVAHSMGGLICRSMIQRFIPEITGGGPSAATEYVDRLFTYGTPHGGIEFSVGFGMVERLRDFFDVNGAEIFGPDRMYRYLTPETDQAGERPENWKAQEMPADGFPVERVFCLVGTNPEDYDVALGLSSKAVGARSDGLVQIDNAYVKDAHRAFVHRSHSGRYGLVNSEEGYQNLRRFLFGDLEIDVELHGLRVRGTPDDEIVWHLESQLAIRGLPVLMHEQTTAHHCPVQIEWRESEDSADTPVPLLTTFLSSKAARPEGRAGGALRHALRLRLLSIREKGGIFNFGDHLEQTADFDDTLVVDFAPGDGTRGPRVWATWNSVIPGAIRAWVPGEAFLIADTVEAPGRWRGNIPFPRTAAGILGKDATITLTVTGRGQSLPVTTARAGGAGAEVAAPASARDADATERREERRPWYRRLFGRRTR
ncbi:alpha/beta hydrolase [Blastococcus sp. CT_GayMR20]|uniref:esterase/lipase family protein n=1 Tax=Blastococcus sp. CT_GayMR20 TaxID=2559609 RepID=UPI001ADDCD63|nr:alpha/beta hydrolase [Blastococcus sp. CT_GayMR20]